MKVICVDLDQTLVFQDTSLLLWLKLLFKHPWIAAKAAYRFAVKGSASAKAFMIDYIKLDVSQLPYNQPLIEWLMSKKNVGHAIWLVTGTHQQIAQAVSDHLGFFTGVMASDDTKNLVSHEKGIALKERFNDFIYIGDHKKDLNVWALASGTGLVSPAGKPKFNRIFDHHFHRPETTLTMWWALMHKSSLALVGLLTLLYSMILKPFNINLALSVWLTATIMSITWMLLGQLAHLTQHPAHNTLSAHHILIAVMIGLILSIFGISSLSATANLGILLSILLTFRLTRNDKCMHQSQV